MIKTPLGIFLSWVYCYLHCSYMGMAFFLLNFELYNKLYQALYYICHWNLLVTTVVLVYMTSRNKKAKVD